MTSIMYVCDLCFESAPEGCGHFDRDELRVWPGDAEYAETTMCADCHENWKDWHGDLDARPEWSALKAPAEMVPVTSDKQAEE